jgi:hypothetical protein
MLDGEGKMRALGNREDGVLWAHRVHRVMKENLVVLEEMVCLVPQDSLDF